MNFIFSKIIAPKLGGMLVTGKINFKKNALESILQLTEIQFLSAETEVLHS